MSARVAADGHRHLAVNVSDGLALFALAVLGLNSIFASYAAAAFLILGTLLILANPGQSLRSLLAWWPLLILPAYCLISVFWSEFPDNTIRYGIQLAFTLVVAVVIAGRVSATTLLRGLFLIYALGVVLSLVIGRNNDGSAWLGIFFSKNAFAAHIAFFGVLSVGLCFDQEAARWLRVAALLGVVVSVPLLVRAQSAGALATIGPSALVIVAVMLSRTLTAAQKFFVISFGAVAALALALALLTYGDEILSAMLVSAGKDTTLTGRTDLWRTGMSLIAEKPLFGVGYRSFWVVGYGPAEQLWAMFDLPSGSGFNFHNLYISNAVDLGLVGLSIQLVIIYVAAALLAFLAVVRPNQVTATLLALHVLLILRSVLEVEVFFEFSIRAIVAYYTFVYAVREVRQWSAEHRPRRPAFALARGA